LRATFSGGPKCLAPVGDRPFLVYLLEWLRSAGVTELILCVGYKRSQIRKWLGDGSKWGFHVQYSPEKKPLGTGGALKRAARLVTSDVCLVVNGDSYLGVDLREMYRFHMGHGALATIAIARVQNAARYGTVHLDRKRRVVEFCEKNPGSGKEPAARSHVQSINGGVYLMKKQLFDAVPPAYPVSLEKEVLSKLVGGHLYGFITRGYFIDIGVPADFARAQTELPKRCGA
jgi:D-glycero-alpha-D-manno-heptose 1-phosphate guanylyltransferase